MVLACVVRCCDASGQRARELCGLSWLLSWSIGQLRHASRMPRSPNPWPERPRGRALPTSAEAGPTSSAVEAGLRFWPRCLPSPGLLSSVDISGIGRRHLLAEIGRDHGPWVAVMPGPAGSPSGFAQSPSSCETSTRLPRPGRDRGSAKHFSHPKSAPYESRIRPCTVGSLTAQSGRLPDTARISGVPANSVGGCTASAGPTGRA